MPNHKSLGALTYCFHRCEVLCSGYTKCVGTPLAFPSDEYFILCVNKSFSLALCCQAGLHLSETERQLHGDPQQRRWDWKVGCGYATGNKAEVILWSDSLWSVWREAARIVFHVQHTLETSGSEGGFKKKQLLHLIWKNERFHLRVFWGEYCGLEEVFM